MKGEKGEGKGRVGVGKGRGVILKLLYLYWLTENSFET